MKCQATLFFFFMQPFAANWGHIKINRPWQKVWHDILSQTQTEKDIGMKTSLAPEQIVEVGRRCSLHHLPAFVIVPYYFPYFSSALSKLSPSLSFPPDHTAFGIVMRMSGSSQFRLNNRLYGLNQGSAQLWLLSQITQLKGRCTWISALLNHAWVRYIL